MKSKINISTNKPRQLKGLQDMGIVDFECRDCGKILLCLQLVKIKNQQNANILTRVAVKCCYCDGYSCVRQIEGQFYPGAPDDRMGFDVDNNESNILDTDVLFKVWNK